MITFDIRGGFCQRFVEGLEMVIWGSVVEGKVNGLFRVK